MADVRNIVSINITRETQGVSRKGFGTPLFIGTNGDFETGERVRTYTSLDGVENDFETTDPEYIAAQRVFGQQIQPTQFKIGQQITDDADVEVAVNAIQDYDNDWYFLMSSDHSKESIETLANWVQAQKKLYITSFSGEEAKDAMTETDPGFVLNDQNMDRTVILWSADADSEIPEAAITGLQAPKSPGSTTWKFRQVSGVTPSKLTPNEELVLKGDRFEEGKGYNTYTNTAGRAIFAEGRTVGGEFIDVMRFADWLEARMRERIFLTLVNSEKIPYTDAGFAIIEGRIRSVLEDGVRVGGIDTYTITVPDPLDRSQNERANRVASGFKFTARLAGAIHFVDIEGTLTV